MNRDFELFEHSRHIHFKCSKYIMDFNHLINIWRQIAMECAQRGKKKIIVEPNYIGKIPILDLYDIARNFIELGFDREFNIVIIPYKNNKKDLRSIETFFFNNGYRLKIAINMDEAKILLFPKEKFDSSQNYAQAMFYF